MREKNNKLGKEKVKILMRSAKLRSSGQRLQNKPTCGLHHLDKVDGHAHGRIQVHPLT